MGEIILKEVDGEDDKYLIKAKSIYVLLADDMSVKIGVSNNVIYRINVLENQTGKTILKHYCTQTCSNSYEIELIVHKIFENKKIYGEWFNIDYLKAVKSVKDIFKTIQQCKYGSKNEYLKGLDEINRKVKITRGVDDATVDSLLCRLQEKANKDLIPYVPKNYKDAMDMLCNEKIKYYKLIKENL